MVDFDARELEQAAEVARADKVFPPLEDPGPAAEEEDKPDHDDGVVWEGGRSVQVVVSVGRRGWSKEGGSDANALMLFPVGCVSPGKRKKTTVTEVKTVRTGRARNLATVSRARQKKQKQNNALRATTFVIGPSTGPRVQVGDGNDSGRRRWRPRMRRRAIGMQYESSSRTTLEERMAWNAAFEPWSAITPFVSTPPTAYTASPKPKPHSPSRQARR